MHRVDDDEGRVATIAEFVSFEPVEFWTLIQVAASFQQSVAFWAFLNYGE